MLEDTYSTRGEVVECLQKLRPLRKHTRDVGPEQASDDERDLHVMSATFSSAGGRIFELGKKEVRVVGRRSPYIVFN